MARVMRTGHIFGREDQRPNGDIRLTNMNY